MFVEFIITFSIGFLFAVLVGIVFIRMAYRERIPWMLETAAREYIVKLENKIIAKSKELDEAYKERDIALFDAKKAKEERNEALLMLSKKFP